MQKIRGQTLSARRWPTQIIGGTFYCNRRCRESVIVIVIVASLSVSRLCLVCLLGPFYFIVFLLAVLTIVFNIIWFIPGGFVADSTRESGGIMAAFYSRAAPYCIVRARGHGLWRRQWASGVEAMNGVIGGGEVSAEDEHRVDGIGGGDSEPREIF